MIREREKREGKDEDSQLEPELETRIGTHMLYQRENSKREQEEGRVKEGRIEESKSRRSSNLVVVVVSDLFYFDSIRRGCVLPVFTIPAPSIFSSYFFSFGFS